MNGFFESKNINAVLSKMCSDFIDSAQVPQPVDYPSEIVTELQETSSKQLVASIEFASVNTIVRGPLSRIGYTVIVTPLILLSSLKLIFSFDFRDDGKCEMKVASL